MVSNPRIELGFPQSARPPERGLGGALQWQYKRQDKNRFFRVGNLGYTNMRSPLSSTHRSFRLQFARRMGAQTDTLQWRHIYCSLYIYYGASDHSSNLKRDHARAMNELARIGDVRFVSVFFALVFPSCILSFKNNTVLLITVLLLPLTTKNSTILLLTQPTQKETTVQQYHYNNMTPTYNSKTAIQYHMIYNNCPIFPLLAKHPLPFLPQIRPLRQVANKLHGYIYSTLATYFYAGIYLHADINGHLLRRYNLVP